MPQTPFFFCGFEELGGHIQRLPFLIFHFNQPNKLRRERFQNLLSQNKVHLWMFDHALLYSLAGTLIHQELDGRSTDKFLELSYHQPSLKDHLQPCRVPNISAPHLADTLSLKFAYKNRNKIINNL